MEKSQAHTAHAAQTARTAHAAPAAPSSDFYNITYISGHTAEVGTTSTFKVALDASPTPPAPAAPSVSGNDLYKITNNPFKKLIFNVKKKKLKSIFSITQNIGIGLPPPRQLATSKAQKNNCYIWDFYAQGSTSLLREKILTLNKSKKKNYSLFHWIQSRFVRIFTIIASNHH